MPATHVTIHAALYPKATMSALSFTLRLWTPTPKMNKAAWAKLLPSVGRAAMPSQEISQKRANVWHDNETFLNQPNVYTKHGKTSVKFPPNSGDLNPIETVWARLRRDLAVREMSDLQKGTFRVLANASSEQNKSRPGDVFSNNKKALRRRGGPFAIQFQRQSSKIY